MKKKASNVFTVPNWMLGLKAREPEGTMTPDQVATVMEMSILLNDGNPDSLHTCIRSLVPKVPLKHQKVLKAFIACTDSNMLEEVQAFINQANTQVAALQEVKHVEPELPELSGESIPYAWDTELDNGGIPGKRSSRGNRALRAAKRGQVES